ncbi:DUF4998 domain-containing protein [Pedobacter heparinus]|uniref:DUF4998 domain-containing protein n=1 Tax=Pedobacter heparinus TaxID=984 RepID=UPI00292DFDFF|nr:DUF4998 domain-containing protein [Pedobacter heparinus]
MDATYKEFLNGGQVVYNGKPEGLQAFSGNKRVGIKWYIISDPKITSAKIFWNNPGHIEGDPVLPNQRPAGKDSITIAINRGSGTDSVITFIDRLKEGIYTFSVYMYDDKGHSSVKSEVISDVYGDNYQNSIGNRPTDMPQLNILNGKSDLYIPWYGVAQQAVRIDLIYTNTAGIVKTVQKSKIPNPTDPRRGMIWLDKDTLFNFKDAAGAKLRYRTAYLPEETAIDTFFTEYTDIGYKYYVPPTPPSKDDNLALSKKITTSSATGTSLTDGDRSNTNKWQPSSGERADLNVWFYVDLGSVKDFNSTQVYFTKDPAKITYYEILYTDAATIATDTKWKRAYIKFGAPEEEDIFVSTNTDNTALVNLKGRYIKINIGLRDEATNINVSEIEVYHKDKL